MIFKNLKSRIKKNEGYSNKPYKDQLGFYTIGYGHLIKKKEYRYFYKTFSKKYFENIFELDFKKSTEDYYKKFNKKKHKQHEKELLIEMIYQLGIKNVVKFKRLLLNLEKKQKYMVCLEMMDSLWYKQTPMRVENLIKNFIKK